MKNVSKAVILAGGYGTRMLPITKVMPKELLPIVDTPVMDFVIEECISSGITDIMIVISKGKEAIMQNYLSNFDLDSELKKNGNYDMLKQVNRFNNKVRLSFVYQNEMLGTAKALQLCESFVKNEPFAVLYADEIYKSDKSVLLQLVDAYNATSKSIIAAREYPSEIAKNYGVIKAGSTKGNYIEVLGIIEKPEIKDGQSKITGVGRFIFNDSIFNYIEECNIKRNGEIYLTDAINLLAINEGVFGYNFEGTRYDVGNKLGYMIANIDFALENKDIREGVKKHIINL